MSLNDKDYDYPIGADAHVAKESTHPTSATFEEPSRLARFAGLLIGAFTPKPKPLIQPDAAVLPVAEPYNGLSLDSGSVALPKGFQPTTVRSKVDGPENMLPEDKSPHQLWVITRTPK